MNLWDINMSKKSRSTTPNCILNFRVQYGAFLLCIIDLIGDLGPSNTHFNICKLLKGLFEPRIVTVCL